MKHSDDHFPFRRVFNLLKLIDFWKESAQSEAPSVAEHAKGVLALIEKTPELTAPELSPETLAKYPDVLSVVMSPVIPLGLAGRSITGAVPPFLPECFYATEPFARLELLDEFDRHVRVSGVKVEEDQMPAARSIHAYLSILRMYYGVSPDWGLPLIISKEDPKTGLVRHFKLEFDLRFVDIIVDGEPKPLLDSEIERLMGETMDLDLWKQLLPPDQFEFHGFGLITATDVTGPEELSLLKDDLLRPGSLSTPESIDVLENRLRVILGRPEVRLGLIALEREEFGAILGARAVGRSLLLSDSAVPHCPNRADSFYAKAFEGTEPVIVTCLDDCSSTCTGFEYHLMSQGIKNLLVAPLLYENERVGLIELASPNAGDINAWNTNKLMQVRHLFATALNRELHERDNRIQAVIKRHYTAIHPAVEWRFRESAVRYMDQLEADGRADKEEIVFPDVYPLYGLSDIRGSSTHRVESIRDDLKLQLELARKVIEAAAREKDLPVLDELRYQLEQQLGKVDQGLGSGDEVSVLEFLRDEIEARLSHLSSFGERVAKAADKYRGALDEKLGVVYKSRKDYETSVARINDAVVRYIESQEERAQAMFPHYFERYQTDGVDYNVYVGDSLLPDGGFDQIYLRNLRLWQLMMTCGIVWEMNALQSELPVSLETAHLILVQSTPLAIRFREEEKQFDVDGAYNARYEIVKKRIDKAVIRGTNERLTQPGQIAIVYAQVKEATEYRRYLDYLASVGYIEGTVEDYELEDLQGVNGLRALRVTVAATPPSVEFEVTAEGEMRQIKARAAVTA